MSKYNWTRINYSSGKDNLNHKKQIILLLISNGKKKLKSHKKVYENKDFCGVVMPSKDTKLFRKI